MTRDEIVEMVERMVALGLTPADIAFFIRAALGQDSLINE